MTMVDWLLTEQLVDIFGDARAKRPELNADLEAKSRHGESDLLAGAGTAVQVRTKDGALLLVTPRRIARLVDEHATDLVVFSDLVGYDWIAPEMSQKVALKGEHYDRLYLYSRDAPPIMLDHLGDAVYPLMTFLGRVLEFQSQKVLLRKLDEDTVELLGRALRAAARGPFFSDEELERSLQRGRESIQLLAGMWPTMNLAAPDLLALLEGIVSGLLTRAGQAGESAEEWATWIGSSATQLEAAMEVFRRVSEGEV